MNTISAEFKSGFGWQYVIHRDGVLAGRYGRYDTEAEALRAASRHVEASSRTL